MEAKKISFGFSKLAKKNEVFTPAPKTEKKIELIECLEGQSIKIKDSVFEAKGPLVIPVGASKNLVDRIKESKEKQVKKELVEDKKPDSELSLDELAARELIRDAKHREEVKLETKVSSLNINTEKFVAEGELEPTLEDYENVPISDYGMAMLRGMGWKEGMPIGKSRAGTVAPIEPEIRPKGLGLGANKLVNSTKPQTDPDGKKLQLIKGAFAKIIAGLHRGQYCQVEGFDDENCRIIVKTSLTNEVLTLNEFLVVPVTKEEYAIGSRVLNNTKYEEYKERERSRSRSRGRKDKKKSKKHKHRSHRDLSDSETRRHKKKSRSRRRSSSDSQSDREYRKNEDRRRK